jgi:hypothetical protein
MGGKRKLELDRLQWIKDKGRFRRFSVSIYQYHVTNEDTHNTVTNDYTETL